MTSSGDVRESGEISQKMSDPDFPDTTNETLISRIDHVASGPALRMEFSSPMRKMYDNLGFAQIPKIQPKIEMKPVREIRKNRIQITSTPGSAYALAATLMACFGAATQAATVSWKPGTVGNYKAAANWDTGTVPGAADIVKIDNSGDNPGGSTVNFLPGDTFSVTTLDIGASNIANNKPLFNQSGGTLSVGTLFLGHPAYGASKSPSYTLSGGTLNIATALAFGNGTQGVAINQSGTSAINYSGAAGVVIGSSGGAHALNLTDSAAFNYTSGSQITIGGGDAAGVGHVALANNSTFTANTVTTILVGNDGTRGNSIDLTENAVFSVPLATIALAQWNNGVNTTPLAPAGTLTLSGTSTLRAMTVKLGGNNLGNPQYGVIYLDGGTIETGSILIGSSTTPADPDHNVIHCSGKIRVLADGNNANFFNGTYVDISGGLKFDTNGNDVTVPQIFHHAGSLQGTADGGFEKLGAGTLFLDGFNTYTGPTVVSQGELVMKSDCLADSASLTIKAGAVLDLEHSLRDRVSSLTLGTTVHTSGVWGSSQSGAPNVDDVHFTGPGSIQVGAPTYIPRELIWSGATDTYWDTGMTANFVTSPATGAQKFQTLDNVTFADPATPGTTNVDIYLGVQPSNVKFTNTGANNYVINGSFSGIGGAGGITKTGTGDVSLGGDTSSFTGPIVISAGRVTATADKAFGNSSGITISSGAQVDLNGTQPGPIYTYTVGGTGPNGGGIIVNSGASRFANGGVRDLILTSNTTVGNDGGRYDIGAGGVLTGNGFTLTKVGNNDMAFRGDGSATPVQVVITAGSVWAENQTTAFGGTTGTLTIKGGARAGTYGTLSIPTPVMIENGGRIHNQGNGTGTWTGAVSIQGTATLDCNGGDVAITGGFGGGGGITTTGGNTITLSAPAYAGDTTVGQGQLTLGAANPNDDARTLRIETGAILNLNHTQVDTVKALFLGGVQVVAGTYGASDNAGVAQAFRTPLIKGTGTLLVTNSPGGSGGLTFEAWADATITNPAYASQKARTDDPDRDGLTNFTEYVFATDPQTTTGSAVQMTRVAAGITLRWNQRDSGPAYEVQQSTTLAPGSWTAVTDVTPVAAADQSGVPSGCTRREVTVPTAAGRRFVRVSGTQD